MDNNSARFSLNATISERHHHHHPSVSEVPYKVIVIYSVIFICDITGNSLVVAVIVMEKRMKSFTNWMLLNLAIADLAVGLFCIPLEIPLELTHEWLYGSFFCKIFYPLQVHGANRPSKFWQFFFSF